MGKVDGLSRRPDWEVGVEKDNKEQILVKKEWLEAKRIKIVEVIIERVVMNRPIPSKSIFIFFFFFFSLIR